jgi:gamma-glutamyltranspeptidase / glutathione hydrolase
MFTTRPELLGTFGVVASTHWLATATGMAMLEKGGNAFDAAVAAGFVLHIAEPHLNGPGGDMPVLIHDRASDSYRMICGQGVAPAGATIEHYHSLGLDLIPGNGLLATVVPGAFDAYMLMLRDYGTMTLEEVWAPAIYYAENGAPLVARAVDTIRTVETMFRNHWHSSAAVYLPGGNLPVPGTLLGNAGIAGTWRRILEEARAAGSDRTAQIEAARAAFYTGFVAEAVDGFCRENAMMDVSGEPHYGVLSGDDMARWRASYEEPLRYNFRGLDVLKGGPWSQGPVLLQQLALLDGFDLEGMDPTGPEFVHTVTECTKLAFADRESFYGDPDYVEVPVETLLSKAYNDARRKLIGNKASLDFRPGEIDGYGAPVDYARLVAAGRVAGNLAGIGEPTTGREIPVSGDTCHIDVIDKDGNMVSATPSGGWLQSSPVIPELGFCLNSRGQMFWLEEGKPATLEPGKRPRSTLSPSMAVKDGEPCMSFGTPGGDQQDQWQAIFLARHLCHGMNLQEAIDAPSFHNEHHPGSFYPRAATPGKLVVEGRFPYDTVAELKRRGHKVEVGEDWSEGRLSAARQDDGMLRAAANPRGMQGYAVGR